MAGVPRYKTPAHLRQGIGFVTHSPTFPLSRTGYGHPCVVGWQAITAKLCSRRGHLYASAHWPSWTSQMAYSAAWQQYYNNLQDQHLAGAAGAQAGMGAMQYYNQNWRAGGNKGQASYYGWDWDQDERYRQMMDLEARSKAEMEQITANFNKAPRRQGVAVTTSSSGYQWYADDQAAKDASARYARAKQAAEEMQRQRWQAYQAYANAYAPPAAQQPAPRPQASVSRPPVARQQAPRPSQPAQQQAAPAPQQQAAPAPQQPPPPAPAPPAPSQQGAAAPVPASTYAGWKPSGGTAVQKQKSWEGWLPPSMRQRQQ